MLDVRHLNHLLALADERHFGRAAQRVNLSQPAFSRSIQALERQTGQKLFDREAPDIKPTPAGTFLIERARQLLGQVRTLSRDMQLYGEAQLGDVAFGVGPYPAATLLPHVLRTIREQHPQVHIRVEVNNWALLMERLRAEDIEFFIADTSSLPQDESILITPLDPQPGTFFVRCGHPLEKRVCTVSEMWSYGVALTRLPPQVSAGLAKVLGLPEGHSLPLALQCDDVHLLRDLALSTDTVVGLTFSSAKADVRAGRLKALNIQGLPHLQAQAGVVTMRGWTLSPMARQVIDVVRAHET